MKEMTIKIDQRMVLLLILGVLVAGTAVQAFQLTSLKTKLAEGGVSLQSSSGSSSISTQSSSSSGEKTTSALPSSIKDLPQMVGGC